MSKLIVDLFEIVEIEENHRKWVAGAFGARNFFLEAQFAEAAIVKTGQRIENREIVEFVGLDTVLRNDLKLTLQDKLRVAVADHIVGAAHADQRNERTHNNGGRGMITETAL